MTQNWKRRLRELALELAGSGLVAVGIYNFAAAARLPMTGFSGIAIILNRLVGLPIGAATLLLNLPVAALCFRLLGKRFFFRSLGCMALSSLLMDWVAPLLPVYQGSRLLAAICTGVTAGLGYALIYMQNSSTGGSDFIIMGVKALRPHLSLGRIAFWTDLVIVLAGGLLFRDVDGVIYGLMVSYLLARVVDKAMYGANAGKMALIVTRHGPRIAQVIEACCGRGSTLLKAAGGYRLQDSQVVMCACSDKQMYPVLQAVKKADPAAFTVVLESSEVHGEGFRPLMVGTPED